MAKPEDWVTMGGILFTDEYQLTMAQLYFRAGLHERPASSSTSSATTPTTARTKAGYCINAGSNGCSTGCSRRTSATQDIAYLRSQHGPHREAGL